MSFASNIYVAVEAEDAEEAHDKIRKLVKGVERAAQEHGIDVLPYANFPVQMRAPVRRETDLDAVETGDPETLFDDKEDVFA